MTVLRQRKQDWPLEEGKSLDRCRLHVQVVVVLSFFHWDGVVFYHTLDLFSAVLEVPVFTVAGGGSLRKGVPGSVGPSVILVYTHVSLLDCSVHVFLMQGLIQ